MRIYITDGTPETFFTAVFSAYGDKEAIITSDSQVQLAYDSEIIKTRYDEEKCRRVIDGLGRYDKSAEGDILLCLRSGDRLKEQTALEYIRKIFQFKAPISKRLSMPEVILFNETVGKVTGEAHKMKGFLRFMESASGILYAPYSPDNNITDLLMPHFAARFQKEKFVIHDTARKIAGMYNGSEWTLTYAGDAEIYLSEYETAFENLWKKYYDSVNIASRPHEKQMRGYMPARYWKFLPEKRDI